MIEVDSATLMATIQEELDHIREAKEDGVKLIAPTPVWHEDDEHGCNWDVSVVRNGTGYVNQIVNIIAELRRRYRLRLD